jgi:hypothetical protein
MTTTEAFELWRDRETVPTEPILTEHGGGGSGGHRTCTSERSLWLWPLPDGDAIDLVFAWPALDMPVTRHPIDVRGLHDAATTAIPYWNDTTQP